MSVLSYSVRNITNKEGSSRGRTRTCDPPVNSRLLYQLSYSGMGGKYRPSQPVVQLPSAAQDLAVASGHGDQFYGGKLGSSNVPAQGVVVVDYEDSRHPTSGASAARGSLATMTVPAASQPG